MARHVGYSRVLAGLRGLGFRGEASPATNERLMKASDPPIVVETHLDADRDEVWSAITERDRMVQWFFDNIPAFKPEVGFQTEFDVKSEDRNFRHQWTVQEVEPGKLLRYRWKYAQYSGDSYVKFELSDSNGGTLLRLSAVTLEDFPEVPEFERDSCRGGWEYFLGQNLKQYLER